MFAASDPNYGLELRGTDRTPGEVVLLADANPGTASSSPRLLGELDGALFYSSGPVEVPTLWRTDGTPEGTRQVRDDRGAALIVGWYAHEPSLVRWRDLLAVEGVDATAFAEAVWTVDAEGRATRLHGEPIFDYPVHLFGLAATRDRIFFQTEDAETHELAVWTSDGSAAGTRSLFEGRQGRTAAGASGEHYFFTAAGAGGSDVLYATDGRGSGAVALAEFGPYPEVGPTWFAAGPTRVYFLAGNAADDRTLWVSDGTPSGTNPVPEPSGGLRVSVYDLPGAEWLDEAFLFGAANESGPGLWVARGDGHAPERLDLGSDAQTYGAPMVEIDGRLLFGAVSGVGGDPALELWSTDGTQGGTRRVSRLCPPACDDAGFENVLRAGGIALFQVGYDWSMFGSEWLTFASDGTEAGTRLLDDSDTGPVTVVALSDAWAARVDGGFLLAAWDEQRGGVEPWHLALGDGAERKVANLQPER
ncbi:MAG: hypothetical protein KDB94_13775, partial [Acidobacteria bacterium]|nr:hypothetical protein [Acidobacteriota bacterium]